MAWLASYTFEFRQTEVRVNKCSSLATLRFKVKNREAYVNGPKIVFQSYKDTINNGSLAE